MRQKTAGHSPAPPLAAGAACIPAGVNPRRGPQVAGGDSQVCPSRHPATRQDLWSAQLIVRAVPGGLCRVWKPERARQCTDPGRGPVRARGDGGRVQLGRSGVPAHRAAPQSGVRGRGWFSPWCWCPIPGPATRLDMAWGASTGPACRSPSSTASSRSRARCVPDVAASRWPTHGLFDGKSGMRLVCDVPAAPRGPRLGDVGIPGGPLGPQLKFVIVSVVAVPVCFAVGYAVTRLPGVGRVVVGPRH